MTPAPPPPRRSLARRSLARRLLYALVLTVAVLAAVTGALAVAESAGWLDTYSEDDAVLYLQGRYLTVSGDDPPQYELHDAQEPSVVQARFPARKARGVTRVFLTGGSFMRGGHHFPKGTPPLGYGTIPDWVREVLEARYPSRRFEVVNAGANGQGSFRVAAVVHELVHASPDVLVVATGNNEGSAPATGMSAPLNDWVLYRLLKRAVREEPQERPAYPLQELGRDQLGAAFAANLADIVATSRGAGVELVLATLPLNLPQIGAMLGRDEVAAAVADPACAAVESAASQRRCDAALEAGTQCPASFYVAVRGGQCMQAAGRLDEAGELYRAAIQLEPRGRTRPSYNQAIRDAAAGEGVVLVDLEAVMEERSRPALSGSRDFIDAVHLTCMGYLPMAAAIVDGIVASGVVPAGRGEPLPTPSASELLARHPWDTSVYTPPPDLVERTRKVCSPDPAFR